MAFLRSLYGRIALIFLGLLIILGIFQVWFSTRSSYRFVMESDQRLNRQLARDLVEVFTPYLQDRIDTETIGEIFHDIMVMNPRVEMYLLDAEGRILAFFAPEEKVQLEAVDVAPIRDFIDPGVETQLPILGDDPRNPGRAKTFSAAPLTMAGGRTGYLYVILNSELYESAADMVRDDNLVRDSTVYLLLSLTLTAAAGLVLFYLVTRRLRSLTSTVERFRRGELDARAVASPSDEIGRLGDAINHMADTIAANLHTIQKKDRFRRELIANVSHDLRGPLASIRGYVETLTLKETSLSGGQRARYLERVLAVVTRLGRLVDELFELSKLEAREVEPRREPFALAELVQDVVLELKPRAEERGVQLETRLPSGLPPARGDIALIERAISNLLENALRFTDQGGRVTLEVTGSDGGLVLRVQDTGKGIPPEDLPHVFERYYRANRGERRQGDGAGLGLAIARTIVKSHGGDLSVRSELGKGTSFCVTLPAHGEGAASDGPRRGEGHRP